MKRKQISVCIVFAAAVLSGCVVKETTKKIIGTSTKTLEQEARTNGLSQQFYCSYQECFESVMELGRKKRSAKPWVKKDTALDDGVFDIFMSDLYSNPPYIILMGVEGNINTTEVGVFFTRVSKEAIRVDISSLSSTAKRSASEIIFAKLSEKFSQVE